MQDLLYFNKERLLWVLLKVELGMRDRKQAWSAASVRTKATKLLNNPKVKLSYLFLSADYSMRRLASRPPSLVPNSTVFIIKVCRCSVGLCSSAVNMTVRHWFGLLRLVASIRIRMFRSLSAVEDYVFSYCHWMWSHWSVLSLLNRWLTPKAATKVLKIIKRHMSGQYLPISNIYAWASYQFLIFVLFYP